MTGPQHPCDDTVVAAELHLPPPKQQSSPNRTNVVVSNGLAFVAGHGPDPGSTTHTRGRVGHELDVDQAKDAARACALALLGSLKGAVGDLRRIERVVRVTGYVSCDADFMQAPLVVDGASDVLVEVFGPRGVHARTAVGVSALPNGIPVEVEAIFEVRR